MTMIFNENIRKILAQRGIHQSFLAMESGLSRQTINKILRFSYSKSHSIKLSSALSISKALEVDFPCLFSRLSGDQIKKLSSYEDEDYLRIFCENIRRCLQEQNKRQKLLSTDPGVSEATISEILTGRIEDPYLSSLIYMAELLDVEMTNLFKRRG